MTDAALVELLNELETRELPLLSWGVTSGAYSEVEIQDLLKSLKPEEDPEVLLERLLKAGLVFERGLTGTHFRTRMAETVRLARHLRQWFPRGNWRTAKTLVSDMRFLTRSRVVPQRDVCENELTHRLSTALNDQWTKNHKLVMAAILNGRSVSEFQAKASEQILGSVGSRGSTCITAGTGTGKTLAFYLPALMHILRVDASVDVPRILAIYPRVELLRDQLAVVLKMIPDLESRGAGGLRVGVLYGDTPHNPGDAQRNRREKWRPTNDGLSSPILTCLTEGCSGELIWPKDDSEGRLLRCGTCASELRSVTFTRETLASQPPEILFTTTEMINRSLGDPKMRRLLIGNATTSPDFILLDEIHTYAGTHGAQVANLIRRWRSEMAVPSHVVGLSATLADPRGFFSQLIGVDAGNVSVIAPNDTEMIESGREYFMALRGDPASQTSLLSTTIQTAMLLRRMLDRELGMPSGGLFGSRLFVFTDKLDVANRLHYQLQDAEGWQRDGVNRKPKGSLAVLRASGAEDGARDDVGQLWDAAEKLGTLNRSVVVDRTTSQDSGVATTSDVVVATASLDVGFDDPSVGAVLQHKAPRDEAQFLQRRGRAGRDPTMRPWTTVVLSDYGRDRLAFQAYEALFEPHVRPTHLPIRNRVILKMQATWWLLDYLSRGSSKYSLRAILGSRWSYNGKHQIQAAKTILTEAEDLLTKKGLANLKDGLKRSLQLSEEDTRSVLFDYPRGIVTAVLPTLIRRLKTLVEQHKVLDNFDWSDPLVDFVPSALFNPLQTPEVRVRRPPIGRKQPETITQPIAPLMREFAPGRVSYRFALRGKIERNWVEPPESTKPDLNLETFCSDFLQLTPPAELSEVVVQPRSIQLARPTARIPDSSYGRWNWEVFFRVNGEPVELDLPAGSPWSSEVRSVAVMTHRNRAPLTVWRLARTVEVERRISSEPSITQHCLQLEGVDAALGFAMEVDGIRIDISLPQLLPNQTGTELERTLRTTYFEYLVVHDSVLTEKTPSRFLREWLAQLALCAVVTVSADAGSSLSELTGLELKEAMVEATRIVFRAEKYADDPDGQTHDPGLVTDVVSALSDPMVVDALQSCLISLHQPLPQISQGGWMHRRYASTVAAGLTGTMQALCPDLNIDELCADFTILSDDKGPFARILITEDQPGGTGMVEAAVDTILDDPRVFWSVVTSTLGPCDGERIDSTLRRFLRDRDEGRLKSEVDQVRAASTLSEATTAWASLTEQMFRRGIDADPTVVSALATRLLRPGSNPSLEQLCRDLLARWDELETRLGLEVELRVFAYIATKDDNIRRTIDTIANTTPHDPDWYLGQVVGLLWSRGNRLRAASLQNYNPYCALPDTERLLVESITKAQMGSVEFGTVEWREKLDDMLGRDGQAQITCSDGSAVTEALRDLMTVPTAVGVLEFYPRVVGVERLTTQIALIVDIREALQ